LSADTLVIVVNDIILSMSLIIIEMSSDFK